MARGIKLRNYLSKIIADSDVYIDQKKTKGQNWQEINDKKLNEANIVLVILTPAALQSHEVVREVDISKKSHKRIIPCKDDSLELEWNEIPWGLDKIDGITFEDDEILKTRLYREITKIIKELTNKRTTIIAKTVEISSEPKIQHGSMPVLVNGQTYKIPYFVKEGSPKFNLGIVDKDASSIVIDLECREDSTFDLALPRTLIDSKSGTEDDVFFVLVDGAEMECDEKRSAVERTLTISVFSDTRQIEIIGTQILGISSIGITKPENVVNILFNSHNLHGGKYLEPETLTVNAGEKVKWENHDTASHTITSGGPGDDNSGSQFDSGLFKPKGSFEITFNEKGTFEYFCLVHPWKIGHIIVK